jgi:capsular polysaccharide biosynthesis protein/Mrp family chromosome partitioning ATPase
MNENRALAAATKIRSGIYAFGSSNPALLLADGFRGFLKRRWRLILRCALIIVGLGIVAYNFLPTYYRATAVIALKSHSPRDAQANPPSAEQRTQLEIQAIQSRELAAQVIDQLKLGARPEFNSELRSDGLLSQVATLISELGRIFRATPVPSKAERDALRTSAIIDEFTARVTVSPLRMTGLIQISFTSQDARTAYTAANAVAYTYIKSVTAARADVLQKAATALEERIASIREDLRESPARGGGLAAMERQLEARKTLLQSYIAKLGDIMLDKSALDTHATVQAPAVLPLRPVGLPLSRVLPLLAVAGLLFGAAIALWRELTARTILAPSQLEALFGLRVLTVSRGVSKIDDQAHEIGGQVGLELLLARQPGRGSVVALISVGAGRETRSITVETARGIAKVGKRVLLIQVADIQRQVTQGNLEVQEEALTASVRNDASPVRRDHVSPMDILTAELNSRSAMAACEKVGKIVSAMSEAYEFVILSVMFSASSAEFRYVAGLADTAAVIVSEGQTERDNLRTVLEILAQNGVQPIGAVVLRGQQNPEPAMSRTRLQKLKQFGLRRLYRVWNSRLDPLRAGLGSRAAQDDGGPHKPSRARW